MCLHIVSMLIGMSKVDFFFFKKKSKDRFCLRFELNLFVQILQLPTLIFRLFSSRRPSFEVTHFHFNKLTSKILQISLLGKLAKDPMVKTKETTTIRTLHV